MPWPLRAIPMQANKIVVLWVSRYLVDTKALVRGSVQDRIKVQARESIARVESTMEIFIQVYSNLGPSEWELWVDASNSSRRE